MQDTVYVTRNGLGKVAPLDLLQAEVRKITFDWNAYLGARATTISSSTWANQSGGVVGLGSATNSGGVTSITVTASSAGGATITNTVTLANGETLVRKRRARVTDTNPSDYPDYP